MRIRYVEIKVQKNKSKWGFILPIPESFTIDDIFSIPDRIKKYNNAD